MALEAILVHYLFLCVFGSECAVYDGNNIFKFFLQILLTVCFFSELKKKVYFFIIFIFYCAMENIPLEFLRKKTFQAAFPLPALFLVRGYFVYIEGSANIIRPAYRRYDGTCFLEILLVFMFFSIHV